jgi:hypothetical protein
MAAQPWDRRKGESEQAYAAFLRYRDLGEGRTLERLSEGSSQTHPKPIPFGTVKDYSKRHKWVDRARAWDSYLQAERDKVAVAEARKWERRRRQDLEAGWQQAERLIERATRMLEFPLVTKTIEDDGHTTVIQPARWRLRDAALLLRTGFEIKAAVHTALDKDPAEMTDAELRAITEESGDA